MTSDTDIGFFTSSTKVYLGEGGGGAGWVSICACPSKHWETVNTLLLAEDVLVDLAGEAQAGLVHALKGVECDTAASQRQPVEMRARAEGGGGKTGMGKR